MPDNRSKSEHTGARRPIVLLLIDTHALFRATVERYLQETWQDSMHIVSTKATVEVLDVAAAMQPQIVLVELSTPPAESLNLISRLRMCVPAARIIALSWAVGDAEQAAALAAGADECLVKPRLDSELLNAIARAPGTTGSSYGGTA